MSTATATKVAIIVLSDPRAGSEESLGRVLNALAAAQEFQANGDDVTLSFSGTGTRWLPLLEKPDHPAHPFFAAVRSLVSGASLGCANVFGSTEDVRAAGFPLLNDYALPGTAGVPSMRRLVEDGYTVLTF